MRSFLFSVLFLTQLVSLRAGEDPQDKQVGTPHATVAIDPAFLPRGTYGTLYNATLKTLSGTPPFLFSLSSGALPIGVELQSTGLIVGWPGQEGNFGFAATVVDATKAVSSTTFVLSVSPPFNPGPLPSGVIGRPYLAQTLIADLKTPYPVMMGDSALPPGLWLKPDGTISGTPTSIGLYTFTTRALPPSRTFAAWSITIGGSALSFASSYVPDGAIGKPYSFNISPTGGAPPYTLSLASGALPPGLTLNSGGLISGTPITGGTYFPLIQCKDSIGAMAQTGLTIIIAGSQSQSTNIFLPDASLGRAYGETIPNGAGRAPFSYSINSGALPPGLFMNQAGLVSGIPTRADTNAFTVRVTDALGVVTQFNVTLQVKLVSFLPSIGPASGNPAFIYMQKGVPFSLQLYSIGGVAPYTFRGISVPAGLTLTTAGLLSGTPTTVGVSMLAVEVTDALQRTGDTFVHAQVEEVGPAIPAIEPTSPPPATVGAPYNFRFTAKGGTQPYYWTAASGNPPPGLSLDYTTGAFGGMPTSGGNYAFILRVADSLGQAAVATVSISVAGQSGASNSVSMTQISLQNGSVGEPYVGAVQASGGTAPYTFSIAIGTPPNGLSLNPATGVLSGTPIAAGTINVTFRVRDSAGTQDTRPASITIAASTLRFSSALLPTATLSQAYVATLQASGGLQPYAFSVVGGSPPRGVLLAADGRLSGTPQLPGTYNFTVGVIDAVGTSLTAIFSITVGSPPFQLSTATLPSGQVDRPYSATLIASNGSSPIRFDLSAASSPLPSGLSLSPSGVLSGTPTVGGSYSFAVRATDSQNLIVQGQLNLIIDPAFLSFASVGLPNALVGQSYVQTLSAGGGTPPYKFTLTKGALPTGLSLNVLTGGMFGIPNSSGLYRFSVTVSDRSLRLQEADFTLQVSPAPISVSTFAPPRGLLNLPYSFTFAASGGAEPYAWSVAGGSLPNGLRLSPGGTISGVPLAPGTYSFIARARDATNSAAEVGFALTVAPAAQLPPAQLHQAYSAQAPPPASGRAPFIYTLNGNALGDLPAGLRLSPDGAVNGVPEHPGEYTFGVVTLDASSFRSNLTLAIVVKPDRFSILTPNLPGATVGAAYAQRLVADGGRAPYAWSVASGTLPAGLKLNPASGELSGAASSEGTYFFVLTAADSAGEAATGYFNISVAVASAPAINAIVSSASYVGNGIAPGEVLTVFGSSLGPATLAPFTLQDNFLPGILVGSRVLFDGVAAPVLYTQESQLSVIAPFSLASKPSVRVAVEYQGLQSAPFLLPILAAKPAIFTFTGSGQGPGAILNQDNSVNTLSNPAANDSVVILYLTGTGSMTPEGEAGRMATAPSVLNLQTQATVNGQSATVLYAGNAPGLLQGIVQVNLKLPAGLAQGPNAVTFQVGEFMTTATVTVFVDLAN